MRIAFVVNRAAAMDSSWTTLHLAHAALNQGHTVYIVERQDFEVAPVGLVVARAFEFRGAAHSPASLADDLQTRDAYRRLIGSDDIDLAILRTRPLDLDLATFAMIWESQGVPMVNPPAALLRVASKTWLAHLTDVCTPATLVTRSLGTADLFHRAQPNGVIVKPTCGHGGHGIHYVPPGDPARLCDAFESLHRRGKQPVVIQAVVGTHQTPVKRLLWLDGAAVGGYLRERAPGEFRHNLKQGATAQPLRITPEDRALVKPLSPHLIRAGIRFAGLDLLDSHIIEVNVLNPGGTVHADRLNGTQLAHKITSHLVNDITPLRLRENTK